MRASFSRCWRRPDDDLSCGSPASNNHVRCPYRIVDQATGREIDWINQYLDYETLRRLADNTLRTYAHELLHFLRWWESVHHTDAVTKDALTESTLLDYVRFQSSQERELTGGTINQRVAIVDRALRIIFPDAPRQIAPGFQTDLLAACTHGHRQTTARLEPVASKDSQTNHRAPVRRRGGTILVQFSYLTGLGHRGIDAAAGTPVARSPGSESRRSAVVRKRRSACAARATRPVSCRWLRKRTQLLDHYLRLERPQTSTNRSVCFSQGTRPRRPDDSRGVALTVSPSSSDHRRKDCQPPSVPPHLRLRYGARRRQPSGPHAVDGTCANPDHARSICKSLLWRSISNMREPSRSTSGPYRNAVMKLSRHAPLEHPLAHQFQRAVESLTAALVPDSARQYRGTARDFLIYLGEDHPDVCFVKSVAPRPAHPRLVHPSALTYPPLAPAVYICRLMRLRCILEELAWTAQLPDLAHLIRREDFPRPPQRLPRALTAAAGSINPTGVAAPQRSAGQCLPAAAPYRYAHR